MARCCNDTLLSWARVSCCWPLPLADPERRRRNRRQHLALPAAAVPMAAKAAVVAALGEEAMGGLST